MRTILLPALLAAAVLLGGCQAAMYRAYESFGIEKRDILVDRVSDARDAQTDAKEQFASALEQFRSIVEVDGGELERTYDRVNAEYERSVARANEVRSRIDSVERVARDLFAEWEDELDEYSNASLRRDSQRLLTDTRNRYDALIKSMRRAESSMQPVLDTFQDQVLVLKHNLNARAIGSLRKELTSIERQTAALMKDMERSIAEANEFISSMKREGQVDG
ncbi:MAG: DUF2959 domain-containing protein [Xanthomonadaceae bacterium]|nr:DUF2959 domain-containing protein [Xanthomonadaceae bacterium]